MLHALHYHSSGFMSPAEGLHFSALVVCSRPYLCQDLCLLVLW